jgi:hypothetical protein
VPLISSLPLCRPLTPTDSSYLEPLFSDAPKGVPLKAQRLMGIETTTTYHRSTFDDWEDEEHLQSANASSRRRSIIRRSKDSRPLPNTTNRDSKWATLSQRFRSSSSTPVSLRLRSSTSSPKESLDDFLGKDLDTIKINSPDRTTSRVQAPIRPNLEQRKIFSESRIRTGSDRSEWAEARASSRALNSSNDSLCQSNATTPPRVQMARSSSESMSSDAPIEMIRSTPPLRFNPSRRPRAPFPSDQQFDSSSADEGKGPDKVLPMVLSPTLARCPSKMLAPSRMMRPGPATPAKNEAMPPRPRRPTESNIFIEKTARSPVSPGRRMMSTPPRPPPPNVPVPPLPLDLAKVKSSGKTEGLKAALGMSSCSPLYSSGDKEVLQTSPETSPQAVVFCGERVAQTFAATIKQIERDDRRSEDLVELIVGGISFEAPLSVLLIGDSKAASSRLAASLQKYLDKQESKVLLHKSSSITLCVPPNSQTRRSKNTVNSYDDDKSVPIASTDSSSSSDESEEDSLPVFAYDTAEMTWTREVEVDQAEGTHGPVKTLNIPTPLRGLTHARSPTSVSLDCDESFEGDREDSTDSDIFHHRRNSATPELVGPNTFIFTTSSPPTLSQELRSESMRSLQVTLHRDPQPYTFVLHYLKKGSLPSYFSEERFSVLERQRALQRLCLESRWLGYTGLAEKCNQALDTLSARRVLSVSQ